MVESSFCVSFLKKDNLPTFRNGGRSGEYQLTKKKNTKNNNEKERLPKPPVDD